MDAQPIPSVGAVIIDDGRMLLVQRGDGAYGGHWAVPAGRQHFGEPMDAAVRREVFEETGLVVEVGDPVWFGDILDPSDPPGYHYTITTFSAFVVGGELQAGDDAVDARWVDLSEVRQMELTPSMEVMLTDLGY